jgi:hypothetical protein
MANSQWQALNYSVVDSGTRSVLSFVMQSWVVAERSELCHVPFSSYHLNLNQVCCMYIRTDLPPGVSLFSQ